MSTTVTIFDCETGPLPTEQILPLMPEFEAPAGYKDPEKIAAAIAAKRAKWLEQAALSAITGQVLVVGCLNLVYTPIAFDDERQTLKVWWQSASGIIGGGGTLAGFCCKMFDLPFLIRRSWVYDIEVPKCIWNGRYFSDQIVDLAEKWECGVRGGDHISLDQLSKFLGVGQKNGQGKDFARLWETDKPKALEYLRNDLEITRKAYERMVRL